MNIRKNFVTATATSAVVGMLWGAATSYLGLSTALPIAMFWGAILGAGVAAIAKVSFIILVKLFKSLSPSPWALVACGVAAALVLTFACTFVGVNTTVPRLIASSVFGALVVIPPIVIDISTQTDVNSWS